MNVGLQCTVALAPSIVVDRIVKLMRLNVLIRSTSKERSSLMPLALIATGLPILVLAICYLTSAENDRKTASKSPPCGIKLSRRRSISVHRIKLPSVRPDVLKLPSRSYRRIHRWWLSSRREKRAPFFIVTPILIYRRRNAHRYRSASHKPNRLRGSAIGELPTFLMKPIRYFMGEYPIFG